MKLGIFLIMIITLHSVDKYLGYTIPLETKDSRLEVTPHTKKGNIQLHDWSGWEEKRGGIFVNGYWYKE